MPEPSADLAQVVLQAGITGNRLTPERLDEIDRLLTDARNDPAKVVVELLTTQRKLESAKRSCAKAAAAAGEVEGILERLLAATPVVCTLEGLRLVAADGGAARARCQINGQLRELQVHPRVDLGELEGLEPWERVLVHPDEMVVIGVSRDPDELDRARGEIVQFVEYYNGSRTHALVERAGQGEEIVMLARRLQEVELAPSDKLVLLHGDARWAIDRIEAGRARSRFEVPIEGLDARLEDLAGLDSVIAPLLEDVSLRLLNPDIREQFALEPLRGLLLFSYKPGMGKTRLISGLATFLDELGQEQGFDVVLYVVKPNELKIMWHGGDARLVRDELCGAIRQRQAAPRTRPLFQIVVLDEVDSLGKRGGVNGEVVSSASDDAVQALLAEMDGIVPSTVADGPPAHVIWCGLTNRPDMLDEALKRPRRFGDFVCEIPAADQEAAAQILSIYGRQGSIPWLLDGVVRTDVPAEELRSQVTRPAIAAVFDQVVLRYSTDGRAGVEVTAGEAMASVHFMEAMNVAKKKAARRTLARVGLPAVALDDVVDGLVEQAVAAARQMDADRAMFSRQMRIEERVTRIEVVPPEELRAHRYLRHQTA